MAARSTEQSIEEVCRLEDQLRAALVAREIETVEGLYAPEFTLNGPMNRIQSRQQTLDILRTSRARQTTHEVTIEEAYCSGDDIVVLMGRETVVWEGFSPEMDGKPSGRRFTDAWHRRDGRWQKFLRQATAIPL